MEYDISAPRDLPAAFGFAEKPGFDITSYYPPNYLMVDSKTAHLLCENTTTDAEFRIHSKEGFQKTMIKHLVPEGIRGMIGSPSQSSLKS
jgi:hypothetical protein